MARATAICTCRVCGKTFEVSTIRRNRSQASSWEEWAPTYYDICDDCEQKAREAQSAEYARQAAEDGLPELKGTEKQILWAEQIRHDKIISMANTIEECTPKSTPENIAKMNMVYDYILTKDTARWWIDNRDTNSRYLLRENLQSALDAQAVRFADNVAEKDEPERDENEITLHPENETRGTVVIDVDTNSVSAYYPKDEQFRKLIKANGFNWNGDCWIKTQSEFTGDIIDRAAEIMNALLSNGYSVRCSNETAREKAVSGSFELECRRWIACCKYGKLSGWLAVQVPRLHEPDPDGLYSAALRIKGACWSSDNKCVAVPVASADLLEDFAYLYDYKISQGAQAAIAEYRAATTITVAQPDEPEREDKLKKILESSTDIIPALRDD